VSIHNRSIKNNRYLFFAILIFNAILLVPQTRTFFSNVGWRWVYILLLSFAFSFILTPLFGYIAWKFNILDKPDERKLHMEATPLLGGAAVFAGFLIAILLNGIYSLKLGVILIASSLLLVFGIVDDTTGIPASIKLIVQLCCTVLVMSFGVVLNCIPDTLGIYAQIGNIFLTFFWIIGITNAMNFFDGMDGLASGLGACISFFLGITAFQTDQPFLGWVSVAMLGSCLGFLPFNLKKKGDASIFLGDAGSTFIGFVLSCVAVYGEWSSDNPIVAFISPVLIFWVLIFDMIHITVDRILSKKIFNFRDWIEYVGTDHLHHRLALVLEGKKKSVLFIYVLTFCLGTSAIVLRNARSIDALLLLIQAGIIVVLITILERSGRHIDATCEDPNLDESEKTNNKSQITNNIQ